MKNPLPPATRSRSQAARVIIAAVVAALACASAAQAARPSADEGNTSDQRQPAQRDKLSPDQQRRPQPLAIFDTNRDGTISSGEIDNAPAALRQLDKNGDGQLSDRELRPPRREGQSSNEGGAEEGPSDSSREGNRPRPPRPDAE